MMGRSRPVIVALAFTLLIAACGASGSTPTVGPGGGGGGTPSSPGASQPGGGGGGSAGDPCTLLTQAQVASATGVSVGAGDSAGDTHSCDWSHTGTSGIPDLQVLVENNEDAGLCDSGSSAALGITVTPVDGVGDKACFTSLTGLGTNLTFYAGAAGFAVTVTGVGLSDSAIQGDEKTLAQDIVGSL